MSSEQNTTLLRNFPLYPFRFTPVYKDYFWGGDRIRNYFRRPIAPGTAVAESWEIVDHANGESVISNGPLSGMTLHEIVSSRPESIYGAESFLFDRFNRFPLMLKYVDAMEMLSVQVHPSEQRARELGYHDTGKSEAWIVVEAKPGSELYLGFNKSYTQEEVENALQKGQIVSLLNKLTPKAGDCFLVEPGTVHSAGKGVLLAEVQQTSDMTFRLYDWDRVDETGQARQLHIEQALKSINYQRGPVAPQKSYSTEYKNCECLVIDERFTLNRWTCHDVFSWTTDNRCHIWSILHGSATAIFHMGRRGSPENCSGRQSDPIAMECMKAGDTLMVPNTCRSVQWSCDSDEPTVLLDLVGN